MKNKQQRTFVARFRHYDDSKIQFRLGLRFSIENGKRRDRKTNKIIPLHYIKYLNINLRGELVAEMLLTPAISSNPYFTMILENAHPGDPIKIIITDNYGKQTTLKTIVEI